MRDVHFYRTQSDDTPVEEFLDALSGKQGQKVVWVLRLVERLDPVPAQSRTRRPTGGLWEVKAQHGGDIFRLLGFFDGSTFLVVSGFAKKTERFRGRSWTSPRRRRRDYLSRRKEHERPN